MNVEWPTAVVPVAGRGSRMAPLTTVVPKELFPVGRLPVLHRVVSELVDGGVRRIVLVTFPGKETIRDYVDRVLVPQICDPAGVEVLIVPQGPTPGNGGAILTGAEHTVDEPFLVVWGDEVFLGTSRTSQLLACYRETGHPCIAVVDVSESDVSKCGIVLPAGDIGSHLRVGDLLEKPSPDDVASRLASVGGFILDSVVLETLRATEPGQNGEVNLSAALAHFARDNTLIGCRLTSRWYETGSPEGYARAFEAVAREENLLAGPGLSH